MELHLFDFDGTLFNSPSPPDTWDKKKGYWWTHPQSLHPPCVPIEPGPRWWNSGVVGKAKESISDNETWAFLCTGRELNSFARYRIPELLEGNGLSFDELYLKEGASTERYKMKVLSDLIRKFPSVEKVQIWEDRHDHLDNFCSFVEGQGVECVGHPISRQDIVCELDHEKEKVSSQIIERVLDRYLKTTK